MKQSTVWKVSKVLSMVPDIEKVLNKREQLLLLGQVILLFAARTVEVNSLILTREDASRFGR